MPIKSKRCTKEFFYVNLINLFKTLIDFLSDLLSLFSDVEYFHYLFFLLNNGSVKSGDAELWIPLIKSTYPENVSIPKSKIVVCDLHFDLKQILGTGKKKQLVVGAVLNVGYVISSFSAVKSSSKNIIE